MINLVLYGGFTAGFFATEKGFYLFYFSFWWVVFTLHPTLYSSRANTYIFSEFLSQVIVVHIKFV